MDGVETAEVQIARLELVDGDYAALYDMSHTRGIQQISQISVDGVLDCMSHGKAMANLGSLPLIMIVPWPARSSTTSTTSTGPLMLPAASVTGRSSAGSFRGDKIVGHG